MREARLHHRQEYDSEDMFTQLCDNARDALATLLRIRRRDDSAAQEVRSRYGDDAAASLYMNRRYRDKAIVTAELGAAGRRALVGDLESDKEVA